MSHGTSSEPGCKEYIIPQRRSADVWTPKQSAECTIDDEAFILTREEHDLYHDSDVDDSEDSDDTNESKERSLTSDADVSESASSEISTQEIDTVDDGTGGDDGDDGVPVHHDEPQHDVLDKVQGAEAGIQYFEDGKNDDTFEHLCQHKRPRKDDRIAFDFDMISY